MLCRICNQEVPSGAYCCVCGAKQGVVHTLTEVYTEWSLYHYRRIKPHTVSGYVEAWNKLQPLWDRPIEDLRFSDYQNIFDSPEISVLSMSCQSKLKCLIGMLLRYAAAVMQLPVVDISKHLLLDGYRSKSHEILSDEEIVRIFRYAKTNTELAHEARIVALLIATGLRPNELFSLRPCDIDFERMVIYAPGSKTTAGKNRIIPVIPAVRLFFLYFYIHSRNSDHFILNRYNRKVILKGWRKKGFYPLMRELGINLPDNPHRIQPYSCRHTFASIAHRAGVEDGILTKMIGHTTIEFTEKVYIHEQLPEYRSETEKMEQLLKSIL